MLIAAFTAWHGLRIFKHQRTSFDVKLALEIFSSINRYWDRITDNRSFNYDYDMGQIFAQFEIAANLFNKSILTKEALPILKDHIVEVYTFIESTDDGEKYIENWQSSPTTFDELRKFLKHHFPSALLAHKHTSERAGL